MQPRIHPQQRPDLTNTHPTAEILPQPQWADPKKIVSLDPFGHTVAQDFGQLIGEVVTGLAANPEGDASVEARVKEEVLDLCRRFPIYG